MTDQIPLNLTPNPDFRFETFEQSDCNSAAFKAVKSWPNWPSPILALIGPPGSGKTHLGQAWVKHAGDGVIFLDNADDITEERLFTLINKALNGDIRGLLIAASMDPALWDVDLPDLKSRLKNIPLAPLNDPDDGLLEPIIRKLFEDRGREVSRDVVTYLMKYHHRSIAAMREIVSELDDVAQADKKDITKTFTARYLSSRPEPDLFSD